MDYNQLKLRILQSFRDTVEYDSAQVLHLLLDGGLSHKDKAVEMALMRYWRQGLLSRIRRGGRFYYRVTERGVARREWLSKTLKPSEA